MTNVEGRGGNKRGREKEIQEARHVGSEMCISGSTALFRGHSLHVWGAVVLTAGSTSP